MAETSPLELIFRRYRDTHGAEVKPAYTQILQVSRDCVIRAAVGYRRADEQPLFLERYLVQSIEMHLSAALRRPVGREDIIEIGNLAADDAFAMISLWGMAANDLGGQCEIAVATLTAPLRRMFARLWRCSPCAGSGAGRTGR
ncbi:thermostable hemolysin [Novosphingobium sp. P6W]|uniref:thermostable hemolysin n=1 Tax=Novosphingobium sp. P6W TaxID=1609758 RepID=UPI000B1CAE8D|nr:thermostable hemolysin [Novosphingobium sp. P6W]